MTEQEKDKWHRKMAVDCFNQTWDYMEKEDRSAEDDINMINTTHASRYHWTQIGTPLNFQRGEWQISRVYSILGRAEPALHHAKYCLKLTEDNDFKDFDLANAYECMARSSACSDDKDNFEKYYKLAKEAGELIEKEGDREWFFKDFDAGNWFGFK